MYDLNYQMEMMELIGDYMEEVEEYLNYERDMETDPYEPLDADYIN